MRPFDVPPDGQRSLFNCLTDQRLLPTVVAASTSGRIAPGNSAVWPSPSPIAYRLGGKRKEGSVMILQSARSASAVTRQFRPSEAAPTPETRARSQQQVQPKEGKRTAPFSLFSLFERGGSSAIDPSGAGFTY